jgi:hypothetical protein
MDSFDSITKSEIEEWALPMIKKVVNEIRESDGKVTEIKHNKFFIEIMSKISNFVRYDKISKTSSVSYSIPSSFDSELRKSKLFSF